MNRGEAKEPARTTAIAAGSGHTVAEEPVTGPGYEALAAAHSRVLAKMSGEIAAAIEDSGKKKKR